MLKWFAWRFYHRPLEIWTAEKYLNAKTEGAYFVFPDGTRCLRRDWHPIHNSQHFDMIYRQADAEQCPWCLWEDMADRKGFLFRLRAWVRGPYIVD